MSRYDYTRPSFEFKLAGTYGNRLIDGAIRILTNAYLVEGTRRIVIEPDGLTIEAYELFCDGDGGGKDQYISAAKLAWHGRIVDIAKLRPLDVVRFRGMTGIVAETLPAKHRVESLVVVDHYESGRARSHRLYWPADLTEYVSSGAL